MPKRPKSHNQNFDPRRAFVYNLERALHGATTGETQQDISAHVKACKLLTPLGVLRGLQKLCFWDLRMKFVRLWATEPEVVEFVARVQRRVWVKIATCEVVAKLLQNCSSKIALPLGRCRKKILFSKKHAGVTSGSRRAPARVACLSCFAGLWLAPGNPFCGREQHFFYDFETLLLKFALTSRSPP